MSSSIQIDSVFLNFGAREVLRGVHLQMEKHQVTGLLGRNGSGKSCLLKIITGQLQAQSKHLRHAGQAVDHLYRKKGLINYLPQHEFHPNWLTQQQLLQFYELQPGEFYTQYPFLKKNHHRKFSRLSGGERRLLEVLLVLEAATEFSILDEPFTQLMPTQVELLQTRIQQLKDRKGLLLTDHQYQNVMKVADVTHIISQGRAHLVTEPDDLKYYGYLR